MCTVLLRAATMFAAIACTGGLAAAWAQGPVPARQGSAPIDPRQALADAGIQFGITYIAEGLANVSGGISTGAIYTGRLDLNTTIDLEKVAGGPAPPSTPICSRFMVTGCRAAISAI